MAPHPSPDPGVARCDTAVHRSSPRSTAGPARHAGIVIGAFRCCARVQRFRRGCGSSTWGARRDFAPPGRSPKLPTSMIAVTRRALTGWPREFIVEPLASPSGMWIFALWVNGPGERQISGDKEETNRNGPPILAETGSSFVFAGHRSSCLPGELKISCGQPFQGCLPTQLSGSQIREVEFGA